MGARWPRPATSAPRSAKATLPSGLLLRDGETIVAAEVVYSYKHWLLGLVPDTTLRRTSYYRPRLSGLRTLG